MSRIESSASGSAASSETAGRLTRRTFVARMAGAAAATMAGVAAGRAAQAKEASSAADGKASAGASGAGDAASATSADLIVVGAGAGGLAAAARAAQLGASVIVLEAGSSTGGTTKLSGGHWKYINDDFLSKLPARTDESDATISEVLEWDPADFGDYADACEKCQQDVTEYLASDDTLEFDSIEYWLCLHYLGTRGTSLGGVEARNDYDVVSPAYYNSAEVAEWVLSSGLEVSDPQPDNRGDGGPLSVEPVGQGFGLIQALEGMATDAGAQIVLGAKATDLVTDASGRVSGVVADVDGTQVTYSAGKGVLLACGGYASNGEMVAEQDMYTGIDDTAPSCEPAANDGTGIEMARTLGAATCNTEFVQFFGFPEEQMGSIESTIKLASASKVLVNSDGVRFCDDSKSFFGGGAPSAVTAPCDQPSGRYVMLGDASAKESPMLADSYDDNVSSGVILEGDTVSAAAEAAGLDGGTVEQTVEQFNGYVDAGSDPDFGRDMSQATKVDGAPYIAIRMAMYAQNTMGGVVIDDQGRVLSEDDQPIAGLYAAGEVTGNFDGICRRHGDNFAQILYYGYLVGTEVAQA
ncbi:MAG: FAD-dependent oxidoreductase [Coriobacteriales bacterium]|jgi:urocanate reductase